MISARVLVLAAGAAALLLGVNPMKAPANAQSVCKEERIRAKSEIRVRGETFATNEAKRNWEKLAEERFGKSYGRWANAKDTNIECESAKSPRVGLPAKVCTVTGRPCPGTSNKAVIEDLEPNKLTRGDRSRRADKWEMPRSGDPQHDWEMVFQHRLATWRDRAETRAYEREMAYQRRLEKLRERYRY